MTFAVTQTTAAPYRLSLHLAALAACAAFSFPVLAQRSAPLPADAAASTPSAATPHVDRAVHRQQWQEKRAARRAEHTAQLKQSLALTPAQESAWTDFTTALQMRSDFAKLGRVNMQDLTTPERIDRMRAMRAQRNAAMDQRADATKAFYAQLQPEQQKTFDQSNIRMMRTGQMGKRGHHQGHQGHHEQMGQKKSRGSPKPDGIPRLHEPAPTATY